MQAETDTDRGSSHQLLLRFGLVLNERRNWLVLVTGGLLPGLAAVLSVVGQDREDRGDWGYLGVAFLALVLSALLQILSGWAADQVADLSLEAADRLRVALKDALQPVAEMIADMVPLPRNQRVAVLPRVTDQAVAALVLLFAGVGVDRVRSVVYRINAQGDMEYVSYFGRGEGVQPQPFVRFTERGEAALAMVRGREDMFVHDIDDVEQGAPDYRGSRSGYRMFISCSITDKGREYGMVTVDAPTPGDLTETDKQLVGLMADLLGVAFAIEGRGIAPPGIGAAAGGRDEQ